MSNKTYTTHSEQETHKVAAQFAAELRGGELVELVGDLGSGKTTFVRGVAEALGAKARVKSPTFTLMNEYPVVHLTIKKIVHLDLYRFTNPAHLAGLALEDVHQPDTVVFIEWPNIFGESPFEATHRLTFKVIDEITRTIEV